MPTDCPHPSELTGVRTGTVINMFVELRAIDVRANVVLDMLSVMMRDMLTGEEIVAETAAVIGLDFIVKVAFAVEEEVLTGEWTEAIFGGATDIGAELDASDLTATMVALEFAFPASFREPLFLSC